MISKTSESTNHKLPMFILTSEIQKQINMSKFFVGLVDGETTETPHLQGPVTGLSLHLGKSYL